MNRQATISTRSSDRLSAFRVVGIAEAVGGELRADGIWLALNRTGITGPVFEYRRSWHQGDMQSSGFSWPVVSERLWASVLFSGVDRAQSSRIRELVLDRCEEHQPLIEAGFRRDSPESASLSTMEREVLVHLKTNMTERAIGELLGRSRHTIHTHVRSIYSKLQVRSRSELIYAFGLRP